MEESLQQSITIPEDSLLSAKASSANTHPINDQSGAVNNSLSNDNQLPSDTDSSLFGRVKDVVKEANEWSSSLFFDDSPSDQQEPDIVDLLEFLQPIDPLNPPYFESNPSFFVSLTFTVYVSSHPLLWSSR